VHSLGISWRVNKGKDDRVSIATGKYQKCHTNKMSQMMLQASDWPSICDAIAALAGKEQ